MTNKHLTDTEVQQYVLQKINNNVDIAEHIGHCAFCKTKTEQYSLLFEEIKQLEKPVFDFILADLVIEQLPESQPGLYFERTFLYTIIFIGIFFISLLYLFGNKLLNLFEVITPIVTGLIITTVISLSVFLCVDMYRQYQTKVKALNFY